MIIRSNNNDPVTNFVLTGEQLKMLKTAKNTAIESPYTNDINFLHAKGFLERIDIPSKDHTASRVFQWRIDIKGRQYLAYRRQQFIRSLWTPIIVSVVANLVIAGIKQLLPLVLQWMSNSP